MTVKEQIELWAESPEEESWLQDQEGQRLDDLYVPEEDEGYLRWQEKQLEARLGL